MKETFNLRRFGLYARKEFRENWKAYALFPLIILTIQMIAIYQTCEPLRDRFYYMQVKSYMLSPYQSLLSSAIITLWMAGSFSFRSFATRQATFSTLMLPVSALERFCYAWIVTIPVSLVLVYIFWHLSWGIATPVIKDIYPKAFVQYGKYYGINIHVSVPLFVFSAAFMLGAVVLGRLSFFKTMGIGAGIFTLLYFAQKLVFYAVLPHVAEVTPPPMPGFPVLSTYTLSKLSLQPRSTFEQLYIVWWVCCLPIALWVLTYLKIKEKEV